MALPSTPIGSMRRSRWRTSFDPPAAPQSRTDRRRFPREHSKRTDRALPAEADRYAEERSTGCHDELLNGALVHEKTLARGKVFAWGLWNCSLLVEEELILREQLHSILFHDDRMGAFADLHVALVRHVREQLVVRFIHVRRKILIPLGVDEQDGYRDARRIVQRLSGGPVLGGVGDGAVRRS